MSLKLNWYSSAMNRCSNPLRSLLLANVLIAGCAIMPPDEPVLLPNSVDKHYFMEAYKADASNRALQSEHEYLSWVGRFYNGTDIYPLGWIAIERMVLDEVDPHAHAEAAATLRRLGKLIAADWAKNNRVRLITTTMLLIWANVIQSTVGDIRLAALEQIRQDVDALLTARLPPEAIKAQRYAKWLVRTPCGCPSRWGTQAPG